MKDFGHKLLFIQIPNKDLTIRITMCGKKNNFDLLLATPVHIELHSGWFEMFASGVSVASVLRYKIKVFKASRVQ